MNTTQVTNNTAIVFTVQPEPVLTDRQIDNRMRKVADLDAQIKALKAQRDKLVAEVAEALPGEHYETGAYKINNTTVKSNRFDSKQFKADHPKQYAQYCKESTTTRFSYTVKGGN